MQTICVYHLLLVDTIAVPVAAAAAVTEQPLQPLVPGTGSVLGDILAGVAISAGALVPLAAVAGCAQIARGAQETALAEVTNLQGCAVALAALVVCAAVRSLPLLCVGRHDANERSALCESTLQCVLQQLAHYAHSAYHSADTFADCTLTAHC
jgi:hypothetical protein